MYKKSTAYILLASWISLMPNLRASNTHNSSVSNYIESASMLAVGTLSSKHAINSANRPSSAVENPQRTSTLPSISPYPTSVNLSTIPEGSSVDQLNNFSFSSLMNTDANEALDERWETASIPPFNPTNLDLVASSQNSDSSNTLPWQFDTASVFNDNRSVMGVGRFANFGRRSDDINSLGGFPPMIGSRTMSNDNQSILSNLSWSFLRNDDLNGLSNDNHEQTSVQGGSMQNLSSERQTEDHTNPSLPQKGPGNVSNSSSSSESSTNPHSANTYGMAPQIGPKPSQHSHSSNISSGQLGHSNADIPMNGQAVVTNQRINQANTQGRGSLHQSIGNQIVQRERYAGMRGMGSNLTPCATNFTPLPFHQSSHNYPITPKPSQHSHSSNISSGQFDHSNADIPNMGMQNHSHTYGHLNADNSPMNRGIFAENAHMYAIDKERNASLQQPRGSNTLANGAHTAQNELGYAGMRGTGTNLRLCGNNSNFTRPISSVSNPLPNTSSSSKHKINAFGFVTHVQREEHIPTNTFKCMLCSHFLKSPTAYRQHMAKQHNQSLHIEYVSKASKNMPLNSSSRQFTTNAHAVSSHVGFSNHVTPLTPSTSSHNLVQAKALQVGNHPSSWDNVSIMPFDNQTAIQIDQEPYSTKSKEKDSTSSSHSITRPIKNFHQCMYCSKKFKQESDLTDHTRIHTHGYQCTFCSENDEEKRFKKAKALQTHRDECHAIEKVRNLAIYFCDQCGTLHKHKSDVKKHK
ncbi:MAG: C2H2-type zinc finger protein, partial [Bacteroidota bacterium]